MDASRDADIVSLEKLLANIGKDEVIMTCSTQLQYDSSSWSSTRFQDASNSVSTSGVSIEVTVKPVLNQKLDLRHNMKDLEASLVAQSLPNVKPLARSRYATINVYRRLFSLVFLGNLVVFVWIMVEERSLLALINAAAANLLTLGVARQPLVVNLMFRIFGAVPRSAPLRLRRLCAKIYCYGGVHSGCGTASYLLDAHNHDIRHHSYLVAPASHQNQPREHQSIRHPPAFHHETINFGQGIQLAKHPVRDWHSFATFPDVSSQPGTNDSLSKDAGFSCLISKAGDWTSDAIAKPPTHLWKCGIPIYGFGHVMKIFSRLIIVTTSSRIGPCLSFLGDPDRPAMRVIWQTKTPLKTCGQPILDLVYQLDGSPEILDTNMMGRVDMLPLVLRLVREFDAEAVCVISNSMVTRKLVFECESRSIPAFGPIFDS